MWIIKEHTKAPVKAWTEGVEFELEAQQQCLNLASMPFVFKHVAVMPDVHAGVGATVGTVFATQRAVIPAAVGVDIGCGVSAMHFPLVTAEHIPDDLASLRTVIETAVPVGTPSRALPHVGSWESTPIDVERAMLGSPGNPTKGGWGELQPILAKHPKVLGRSDATVCLHQCGTLGGGNHFIELCLDENNTMWLMLHSGSRGIGNKIGSYFTELARGDMRKWFINLPDKDLAYFPQGTEHYDDYIEAVGWAQDYAHLNRQLMLSSILSALRIFFPVDLMYEEQAISCHHNYVTMEHHFGQNVLVTRKGAVRAREGDLGIIPGSMGTRSYIVRGRGNPDSFMSCSHGAGRRMSRAKARATFSVEDHKRATEGVECRKDAGVLDETPGAYKDVDAVIAAESDLVEVLHTLKAFLCVKG